jgi:hypothetical protein
VNIAQLIYDLEGEVNSVAFRCARLEQELDVMILAIEKLELKIAIIEADLAVLSALAVGKRSGRNVLPPPTEFGESPI